MWTWIKSNWALIVAVAGYLAWAGIATSAILEERRSHEQSQQSEDRAGDEQRPSETWTIEERDDGSYQAQRYASDEGEHEGAFGLPISADEIIAVFTVVLAFATGGLWLATGLLWREAKQARVDASKTLKLLERPYVHFQIENENLALALDYRRREIDDKANAFPWVWFKLRNHGRTQAYITHVEMNLIHDTGELVVTTGSIPQSPYKIILSQGEATETLYAELTTVFKWEDCDNVVAGHGHLRLFGFFNYEDAEGNGYSEIVLWRYNTFIKRLVQVRQKGASKGSSI